MGMMFAGSEFCPSCGARAQAIAQGVKSKRSCPRCNVALVQVQVANTPLEECTHCGGLWIEVANFDRICSSAESQTAATGLCLPPPAPVDMHVRYIKCPQCGSMMNRTNYAGRSGVVIEICRAHGIWLDRDQIRQIVNFIRAGGLDRTRAIEKEELHRQQMATEAATRIAGSGPLMGDARFTPLSLGHPHNVELAADLIGGLASILLSHHR
jgi:Zn-finger nucleic acid-binding protein